MTKRYYISAVSLVDTGGGREVVLAAEQIEGVSVLASNVAIAQDGSLVNDWALCVVEAANHALLNGQSDVYALPVYALDAKVSAMHTPTKTAMVNAFKARGIPTDWVGNADGFREVIRTLGKMVNPAFDENAGSWAI